MDLATLTAAAIFTVVLTSVGVIVGLNEQMQEERRFLLATRIGGRPRPAVLGSSRRRAQARWGRVGAWIDDRLRRADSRWTVEQVMIATIVLGVLGAALVAQFGPLAMVPTAVGAGSVPLLALQRRATGRSERMADQLPVAIDMLITYLRGGGTFQDALRQTAREAPSPLKVELQRTSDLIGLGVPMTEAFAEVSARSPDLHALHFVLGVIEIQQRTGGNLIAMLGRARDAQRDARAMKERLVAASQEVRTTSRVLGILPLAFGLLMLMFAPDYLSTLLDYELGRFALMFSALWMLIGIGIMERLQVGAES